MNELKNTLELIDRIRLMEKKCGSPTALASLLGVKDVTLRSWKNQNRRVPELVIRLLSFLEEEYDEERTPGSIIRRIRIMEKKLDGVKAFADAMAVSESTVRAWKNRIHKMPPMAIRLFVLLEQKVAEANPETKPPNLINERIVLMEKKLGGVKAFADAMRVSPEAVKTWKNGSRTMPESALKLLAFLEEEHACEDID